MALSNSQYDEIFRSYDAKQLKAKRDAEVRMQDAYTRAPRLREIDAEIASASVSSARRLLDGDEGALLELKKHLKELCGEKKLLLKGLHLPEDYFDPVYECPDCKDTGYVDGRPCHCFTQQAINLIYAQSNIQDILKAENFDALSFDYYSDDIVNPTTGLTSLATARAVVARCHRFIDEFDDSFSNLLFYGDTGIGKTFLSNCIAKELLDAGHSVIYFTAFQLFDIFEKNTFHRETDEDIIAAHQNIFDCDLLIIDDLGTELPNSFTISQLFLCLNERILRKKSTIISTNLTLNQIAEIYSERTFSRISSNYVMLKLFGDDIRIQKKFR